MDPRHLSVRHPTVAKPHYRSDDDAGGQPLRAGNLGPLDWNDADDASPRAVIFEPNPPFDLREDRVVFAETGIQAGTETPAALPHDDGAAADEVAVVGLDPEALGIRVAAVPRAPLSFFVSH
jgi:hypothetical protein